MQMQGAAFSRLTGHPIIPVCMLSGFLLVGPTVGRAQTDSLWSQSPEVEASHPTSSPTRASRALFHQYCTKCHGADGTGSPARGSRPRIPDFTLASWQGQRTEAQLLVSILDGKGTQMPPWRGKISEEQTRGLATYIRAFDPSSGKSPPKGREEAARFDERYRRLQQQLDELQKQFRNLVENSSPVGSPKLAPSKHPASRQYEVSLPSPPEPVGAAAVRDLYRKRCARCHGIDGTGTVSRRRLSDIPDFTTASWHRERSDTQLSRPSWTARGRKCLPSGGRLPKSRQRAW
jgi:mono/diheme cytochrome c family protein